MNSNDSPSERIRRIETSVLFEELPSRSVSIKTLGSHARSGMQPGDHRRPSRHGLRCHPCQWKSAVTPSTKACSISKAVERRRVAPGSPSARRGHQQLPEILSCRRNWQPRVTLRHLLTPQPVSTTAGFPAIDEAGQCRRRSRRSAAHRQTPRGYPARSLATRARTTPSATRSKNEPANRFKI